MADPNRTDEDAPDDERIRGIGDEEDDDFEESDDLDESDEEDEQEGTF
ncbi:MAG TPA: hypothetical protein VNR64_15695 [Vicinamibacterales bacterium]|nr:hypothetical protein [Vicinamibacterales bacterium]